MAIENKCMESIFSLTGEEGGDSVNLVDYLRYLGQLLHRSDNDRPEVLRKIWKVRQIWGHLWKFL